MRRHRQMSSILPPGMDGNRHDGAIAEDGAFQDWQENAAETNAGGLERSDSPAQRTRVGAKNTIRVVTPDRLEEGGLSAHSIVGELQPARINISSPPTSPRARAGRDRDRASGDRRHGLVFQDPYGAESPGAGRSTDGFRSAPPVSFHARSRTHTMDEYPRHHAASSSVSKSRHRIGSVHSTTSPSFHDVEPRQDISNSLGFPSITTRPPPQLQKSNSVKNGRRLVRKSSRTASPPVMSDVPTIDSLPFPVATGDANKILMLMKTLCGRMRGGVEYQDGEQGPWHSGICYIDDVNGSLMCVSDNNGPFPLTVVPDLRGCRVRPVNVKERSIKCLEVSNPLLGVDLRIYPLVKAEYDLWLAALLCWQQIRSSPLPPKPLTPSGDERRPSLPRRDSSFGNSGGNANIIKVAKLLLWDRGPPSSPSAIVRRSSTTDLRSSSHSSWRRVSCILQDNGEFKLLTENDVTLLSVIQLSQLSRSAIQRLDKSVLGEKFCIAIFPQYTSTSTQLSIFRPVYIALETRILFEVWFCLLRAFSMPDIYGPELSDDQELDPETPYTPPTNDMFRIENSLTLRVVEAKIRRPQSKTETAYLGKPSGKPVQDSTVGDYFAEVILDGEIRARTITKTNTRYPFWREDYEFLDLPAYSPKISLVLKRLEHPEVATHGFLSSSSVHVPEKPTEIVCGTIDIPLDKFETGKDCEAWFPILDDQQESLGDIFLKLRHDEVVVLLARDYQDISELLHRFDSGLTIRISQAMPSNLRTLSEILVNIFQVSGHAGDWLMALVEDEIDGIGKEIPVHRIRWSRRISSSASSVSEREQSVRDMSKSLQGEANLLFRGNSLLTQALDFHMRRLGHEYLEEVLSEKILEINSLNADCEVDPSRISQGVDVNKNWVQLMSLTTSVWESIAESANRCPPGIRQILKYIRAVAADRYGDFLRTVAYTSVSGFLFLRFFCPAILNPKLFGLLPDHPQPKAQRTLTLIAKSLQALANLSTFGQKEEWMEPMNKFLTSHRQGVKDYIDDICSIPSERNNIALPASYTTPITILARLPPTSREGFPSLPYLIDHARNFAALVKLWLDTTANSLAPSSLDGDLLNFNQLCINLQRRADECLRKAEGNRNTDQTPLSLEDVIGSLEATALRDAVSPVPEAYSPPPPIEATVPASPGRGRPPGSAGSELGIKERREKQKFWEQTFGKESKSQKPYDFADTSQASPPSGGQGRNGKQSRSFLGGLRWKGKGDTLGSLDKDGNFIAGTPLKGNMI